MTNPEKSKPSSVLQPCPCGKSSDACSYWDSGGWYCHSCNKKGHTASLEGASLHTPPCKGNLDKVSKTPAERGISDATLKHYRITKNADGVLSFPYAPNDPDEGYGYKRRTPDKQFTWENKPSKIKLFGQDLFPSGGQYVTVVEGEFDACYAFEAMGSKYPVVSVDSAGAAVNNCKDNYDWLNSFQNIILTLDNDKPGAAAAAKVADLFPGKTKIVKFKQGCKDPCDYGPSGKAEFVKSWWQAEIPVIEGLIPSSQLIDEILNSPKVECFEYPWPKLTKLTYGWRMGELVMVGAGTGIGKTLLMTHIVNKAITEKKFGGRAGVLFLESPNKDAAKAFVSVRDAIPYHLPDCIYDPHRLRMACDEVLKGDDIIFYNNNVFGANSVEAILSKILQMIKVFNCKLIVLDHITFVISANAEGDERRTIDQMVTELKSITVNYNVNIHCISHFKRLSGISHENGAQSSISDFRGSGALGHLANIAIGAERDQQNPDPVLRNTTILRVLKNRFCGRTGETDKLIYSEYPFTWDAVEDDMV